MFLRSLLGQVYTMIEMKAVATKIALRQNLKDLSTTSRAGALDDIDEDFSVKCLEDPDSPSPQYLALPHPPRSPRVAVDHHLRRLWQGLSASTQLWVGGICHAVVPIGLRSVRHRRLPAGNAHPVKMSAGKKWPRHMWGSGCWRTWRIYRRRPPW